MKVMKRKKLEKKGYKIYENEEIIVFWNGNICKHAGECVKGSSKVFNPKRRPWIDLSKEKASKIANIIDKCPSQSLQYELKNDISIVFEKDLKRSAAYIDNNLIGECEFDVNNSNWVITHTGVRESYEGQGIAKKLVKCVIEEARKNQVKIIPLCSYAKKLMTEQEDYQNILQKI